MLPSALAVGEIAAVMRRILSYGLLLALAMVSTASFAVADEPVSRLVPTRLTGGAVAASLPAVSCLFEVPNGQSATCVRQWSESDGIAGLEHMAFHEPVEALGTATLTWIDAGGATVWLTECDPVFWVSDVHPDNVSPFPCDFQGAQFFTPGVQTLRVEVQSFSCGLPSCTFHASLE